MSDGSSLRQSWYNALDTAESHFKQLLGSPASDWKRISNSVDGASKQKGKTKSSVPEVSDVLVHRSVGTAGDDVWRTVLEVPTGDEPVSLETWKSILTTPELRQEWDPAVEEAHLLEMFDRNARIAKTNYTLGWPANPRDSVTISRTFSDATTLIDITTSLPRSPDEPTYLRPAPPYVRSEVKLFAWCVQHIQPPPLSPTTESRKSSGAARLRITCIWQHDLKELWGFGASTTTLSQQLSTMTLSLFKTVTKRGGRVPKLTGYGNGVSIERVRYQIDREALNLDYAIIPDDDDHTRTHELHGMDEVVALREYRRLTRSIECVLPSLEGWDVQVTLKGSSDEVEALPWSAQATRCRSNPSADTTPDQILLRITHAALIDDDDVLKVKVKVEVSGGTRGLRLNGLPTTIHDLEERDPTSYTASQKIFQDMASAVDLSVQTSSSMGTMSTSASSSSGSPMVRPPTERTPAAEKSILSKVRRNYIYFSSLLQEPEAKWRRTTEARGVSITQLDSIDPTLVVYRAEATFVGVSLWDLYAAVVSPGARIYWDKQHEDGVLLEDVNELTELWHFKTKPAWPVNGRDAVVLKTVYKSPTTIHVFSFSADDPHLFPNLPPAEPNVIRTQVDLQGWAIEALSPNTTLLTLLEQSDPKGWTNKTSIPTQMISTLAGIGEFAIKCGGPPIITRLAGSKANEVRYDHEKGSFRLEYEPSEKRRALVSSRSPSSAERDSGEDQLDSAFPTIECEVRCDMDTWGASLDIVVDPPPQTIACLRRHKLSTEGGGLWLTLTHDTIFVDDERLLVLVRRSPGKEKGLVMVNGAKVQVDAEELSEQEIKALLRQKRVKPPRIPLDQPPVVGAVKKKKAEWVDSATTSGPSSSATSTTQSPTPVSSTTSTAPRVSSPLARFWTYAVEGATDAVAAISPASYSGASVLDPSKFPMQYALEALAWAQEFNSKPKSQQDGWTLISDKGLMVHKKVIPEISPLIPIHKGFKVIEGVSAEELAAVIMEPNCRKTWDERFDSSRVLEIYGGSARTTFFVAKGGFPFRDRGFYLANVMARGNVPISPSSSSSSLSKRLTGDVADQSHLARNAIFCVSASFSPDSDYAKAFAADKYNPYVLPIGRVYIDAWILETLDPYTKENYAIPSSRCTRLIAVDYAGSIPAAVNAMINTTLARGVLAVEAYMKKGSNRGSTATSNASSSTVAGSATTGAVTGVGPEASLPVTRLPAPALVINERASKDPSLLGSELLSDGHLNGFVSAPFMAWTLKTRDEHRVLLESGFDIENRIYRTSVLMTLPKAPVSPTSQWTRKREESTATIQPPAINVDDNARPSSRLAQTAESGPTPDYNPIRGPRQRQISEHSITSDGGLSVASESTMTLSVITPKVSSGNLSAQLPMPGAMVPSPSIPIASPSYISSASRSGNVVASSPPGSLGNVESRSPPITPSTSPSPSMKMSPYRHDTYHSHSRSPPPRLRQRAASSGGGVATVGVGVGVASVFTSPYNPTIFHASNPNGSNISGLSATAPTMRGRTISTAFSGPSRMHEEREKLNDSTVTEIVLDSRIFNDAVAKGKVTGGTYAVDIKAYKRAELTKKAVSGAAAANSLVKTSLKRGGAIPLTNVTSQEHLLDVPLKTTIFTLPLSPLHSSSLNPDGGANRHLLRFSLLDGDTTPKEDERVLDPLRDEKEILAGAVDSAEKLDETPTPAWRADLLSEPEDAATDTPTANQSAKLGKGIVFDITIRPLSDLERQKLPGHALSDSTKKPVASIGRKSSRDKGKEKNVKTMVLVNGKEVLVLDEKESLGALGREELLNDRVRRMSTISR
ncbi:hypothetical protein BJ165DRAFT_400191 [Panaeolus papilionaceus]|nr:hypothetical protein BJ165DRAFT_400191 [Panaeolus papilionaceus]